MKVKGVDYEFVDVDFDGEFIKSDEFKAWNPNALVPVIRDGDFSLFEGYGRRIWRSISETVV